jgi:hypothetical protein
MNKSILYSAVTAALAINIAACGSSGSDVAGIGGSGITPTGGVISSGTITGFGSIFVNGVEYETSSSTFDVDGDLDGVEDDLAVGMRVTVTGEVNDDGITGTATSVSYDDELQGPVSNLSDPDLDGVSRSFTVFGTTVSIDSTTTNFDVSDDIAAPVIFDFDSIEDGDHVEISGYIDSNGTLIATRVELKSQSFNPGTDTIELKGTITGLNNNTFSLSNIPGVTIDATAADIEDLPNNQLAEGAYVEVKGMCTDASCTTIDATKVEGESVDFDDDDDVELEGIITDYVSDSNFKVNGYPVDASSAQREPASLVLDNDLLVEVEGSISNGVLVASEIEQEGGEIKIAAFVAADSIDASAGSFDLEPVSGQTITVKIDTSTEIEDKNDESIDNPTELLNSLMPSDYLMVEGYADSTGTVIAASVKRDDEVKDVILQGVFTACSGDVTSGTVSVLGVDFPYDNNTKFEDEDESTYSDADQFCSALSPNSSIVKIKDEDQDGTADEIDKES